MKRISQRTARKTLKELNELRSQVANRLRRYSGYYPGGIHIATLNLSEVHGAKLHTASVLEHALVIKLDGNAKEAYVYAVKP